MADTNFDKLLKRYLNNETSEEETTKIEAWLEIMKTENTDNLELSEEDEEKLFRKIIKNKDNIREIEEFQPWKKKRTLVDWTLRVAAGLLILFMVSYAAWYFTDAGHEYFQANTGIEKVILEDGTLVWLKGEESKVAYYNKEYEGIRFAEFQGEALFEVAKDPEHPFVIQCGEVTLKVLGTSFNVKTNQDSLELKVLTGKVKLSVAGSESMEVEPNQKVVYASKGKLEKQALDKHETKKIIADTEYDMQFEGVDLKEAVDKLQKKFEVTIKLENKQIGKCRITVDLTDHSLESSLKMIAAVLDIQYQQKNKTITINGTGCK